MEYSTTNTEYMALFEAAERVSHLSHSRAFDHVMYDNRLTRNSTFQDDHLVAVAQPHDINISHKMKKSQLPYDLQDLFPDHNYDINHLSVSQSDSTDWQSLEVSFKANDTPHHIQCTQQGQRRTVNYQTYNIAGDKVHYNDIPLQSIIGLIASFVYAQQYSGPGSSVHLDEPAIEIERPDFTTIVEQMIMTLGENSGRSSITTTSLFDGLTVAELTETESPDLSEQIHDLSLSEMEYSQLGNPITTEALVKHSLSNFAKSLGLLEDSTLDERSATIRHYSKTSSLVMTERINQHSNFAKWGHLCQALLATIEPKLKHYAYLDSEL